MSAQAGWYPDPGGGQGLYRYWDGRAWSAATTPNPNAAPPTTAAAGTTGQPTQPLGGQQSQPGQPVQQGQPGQQPPGQQAYGQQGAYANYQQTAQKKSPIGWWIGAGALVLVLVLVGVLVISRLAGGGDGNTANPQGQTSQDMCPTNDPSGVPSEPEQQGDGRVHGGPLSYPMLAPPWSSPQPDNRVPFGTDVAVQQVTIEPSYQPGKSWVASVLIGKLNAGDGFYTPQQGSEVVVKCILGAFYGDAAVQSDVQVNKETKIDGHDAWLVESQLHFEIEGLQAKGELLIVAIVATGAEDGSAGLYYASIPDNAPELVAPAREALKQLKIS